jgi:phosphate starvation-inducible PhoH-like protein
LANHEESIKLLGKNGEFRKRIQQAAPAVRIVDRGAKVVIIGEEPETRIVEQAISSMLEAVRSGHSPTAHDWHYALDEARANQGEEERASIIAAPAPALRGDMQTKPRTRGQADYLEAIRTHGLTIGVGPAGTGKTYLAMAAAVSALLNKSVERLILTRPAVEAGENLGFLPGDLKEKVNPYLRPLYDALYAMVDRDRARRMLDREVIEVAPLAFMRGRTLSNAFVILDEAQNTTCAQMKMFLTRLGENSKCVVTGDTTQIDLPPRTRSGLLDAMARLEGVEDIAVIRLKRADVVRARLVQNIVEAYEQYDEAHPDPDAPAPAPPPRDNAEPK